MSDDLVKWLGQQLDEDERIARTAMPGPWRYNPDKHHRTLGTSQFEEAVFAGQPGDAAVCVAATGPTDDRQSMDDALHIACHDPARVLREIVAKRQSIGRIVTHASVMGWDEVHRDLLRLLALPYADRPGYREEWRP